MKTQILALILMVLALPFAAASEENIAEEFDLEDFSIEPIQARVVYVGDLFNFNFDGKEYSFRVKEISRDLSKVKLMIYIDNKGNEVTFGTENNIRVDLNKDGNDEIVFDINTIEEGKVTMIIADMKKIEEMEREQNPVEENAPEEQGVVEQKRSFSTTFLVIGAIVILLLFIASYRKNFKKEADEEKAMEKDKSNKKASHKKK